MSEMGMYASYELGDSRLLNVAIDFYCDSYLLVLCHKLQA